MVIFQKIRHFTTSKMAVAKQSTLSFSSSFDHINVEIVSTEQFTIIEFFTISLPDAFLSDYLTDLKLTEWCLNSQPPDHQSHTLLTVLSHYLVVGVNHYGFYKVMLY